MIPHSSQLETFSTGLGTVRFLQLVGLTEDELTAVQVDGLHDI